MGVQVTARGNVSDGTRKYAEEKASKLTRFFEGVSKIEIILDHEGQQQRAEIILSVAKGDAIATHADHDSMRAAIDLVLDKAEKRLVRHKEKLRDHRGNSANVVEKTTDPDAGLDSYQDVVDGTDFPE
ncbi:MAG: ribosome-associated translation inhibitor RaiA [Planctomycetota bacterium]